MKISNQLKPSRCKYDGFHGPSSSRVNVETRRTQPPGIMRSFDRRVRRIHKASDKVFQFRPSHLSPKVAGDGMRITYSLEQRLYLFSR